MLQVWLGTHIQPPMSRHLNVGLVCTQDHWPIGSASIMAFPCAVQAKEIQGRTVQDDRAPKK
jgi:hypothetical protein